VNQGTSFLPKDRERGNLCISVGHQSNTRVYSLLEKQIHSLKPVVERLKKAAGIREKLTILDEHPDVKGFLENRTFLAELPLDSQLIVKSIIVVGQAESVLEGLQEANQRFKDLIEALLPVEKFYSEMGGIVGYHWLTLFSLCSQQGSTTPNVSYLCPQGVDISKSSKAVRQAIFWGIENLPLMAEIYPVGGAADRLRLQDEKSGMALPAAKLLFGGRTLLEGMVVDLQAREYLYYKLFGKQLTTPIAMMTSQEKDNHAQIRSICQEKEWFNRPEESFFFFCQPLVPSLTKAGNWCVRGPLKLLMKPGGHGVIWKLARDEGVFSWFDSMQRKKALIRQINNPIASIDNGLLAFTGLGCQEDKHFGFASCPRQIKASEGINVLIERETGYTLTNIEYCDFDKYRIVDEPAEEGSPYSPFPSNTNILFIDLQAVCALVDHCPLPGMIVNLKKSTYRQESGEIREEEIARLESTMQNIADCFSESSPQSKTFLTLNERHKTISTAKREFVPGSSLLETPEGCFLDLMRNAYELLACSCGMQVPPVHDSATFFAQGPSFICFYHPALGPLYSLIAQKIRGGRMHPGSELQLEIAEVDIEALDLAGTLCIHAESVMGHGEDGSLRYSEQTGKCTLKNVCIRNLGIDGEARHIFWKKEIFRKEACTIILRGNGEFHAENTTLEGNLFIEVEEGTRVTARMEKGRLHLRKEPISSPTWQWEYSWNEEYEMELKKIAGVCTPAI
jgi:hypothetical protein